MSCLWRKGGRGKVQRRWGDELPTEMMTFLMRILDERRETVCSLTKALKNYRIVKKVEAGKGQG